MSEIIVARFPDLSHALAAKKDFTRMGQNYTIEPEDIEVVSRGGSRIDILPEVNLPLAHVAGGAIWGAVLGAVFLMPLVGAAVGSVVGYVTGRASDVGIARDYLRQIGRDLAPGEAAVALLARKVDPGAVAATIKHHDGEVMRSSVDGAYEAQIETWDYASETSEKADLRKQPELA